MFNEPVKILESFECVRAFSVYVFLLMMIISLLRLFFIKDNGILSIQKIIGGLAVFVVAIISESEWVIGVSLFIGGLIIASEEFMQKLAIIMRSNSADIGKNLMVEPATDSEITEKQTDENMELNKCDEEFTRPNGQIKERKEEKNERVKVSDYFNEIRLVEQKTLEFLSKDYGIYFRTEIKLGNERGNLIADGIIYDPINNSVSKIVEIKYIRPTHFSSLALVTIRRALERIRFIIDLPILIVLVSKNVTKEEAISVSNKIKKFGNVDLRVFNISDDDGHLEIVY
jgi:hypothetical protein